MNNIKYVMAIISLLLLSACGGGDTAPAGVTSVKLKVVLQGSDAALVKGIQATITLPAGVVISADADGKILGGKLTSSLNTASIPIDGKYTAVNGSNPASVTIGLATTGTLSSGDFVALDAELAAGVAAPAASAFTISSSKLSDAEGNPVTGTSLAIL